MSASEGSRAGAAQAEGNGSGMLLALVPGLLTQAAQQAERLASLERSGPELGARLDGRITSMEGQIRHLDGRLDAQDAGQAAFRLEVKSQLGTLQAQLGSVLAGEQKRVAQQEAAEQRALDAAERARAQAEEQRADTRRWAMQTVASVGLMLPGVVWPLVVTRPLPLRLGVPAVCIGLVLALAAWAWLRSRR